MTSKTAKKVRCDDVLRMFADAKSTFFTFTTADVVTYSEIRERWRNLRHHMARKYKPLRYVMNYELHPNGHGWHIHCVFDRVISLRHGGLADIQRFGFGRVNCKLVNNVGVADYLTKHCLKAYRGVKSELKGEGRRLRLVNCSRGLPALHDYKWTGEFNRKVAAFMRSVFFKVSFGGLPFYRRFSYASLAVINGWNQQRLYDFLYHNQLQAVDVPFL